MKKEIKKMYKLIDNLGIEHKKFIIGSYAFGLKNYRDIDICIYPIIKITHSKVFDSFINKIDNIEYSSDYGDDVDFSTCKCIIDGIHFHLIIFHDIKAYKNYSKTTKNIKNLIQKDKSFKQKMENKTFRVSIFEAFKDYYRHK